MRVSRITGVLVALATTAAVLCGSSVGAPLPAAASTADPATELPREINGGVELTLADGDLLRVWASKDYRTVWAKRRDVAAGEWGQRQVVLRKKHLFCGAVKARTANGAVAVLAECDRYGYAEDQAPVASRAIWSADAVTWTPYARHLPRRHQRRVAAGRGLRDPDRRRLHGPRAGHARSGVHRDRDHHRHGTGLLPLRRPARAPLPSGRVDPHRRRRADPPGARARRRVHRRRLRQPRRGHSVVRRHHRPGLPLGDLPSGRHLSVGRLADRTRVGTRPAGIRPRPRHRLRHRPRIVALRPRVDRPAHHPGAGLRPGGPVMGPPSGRPLGRRPVLVG